MEKVPKNLVGDKGQQYEIYVTMDGQYQRAGWMNGPVDAASVEKHKFICSLKIIPGIYCIEIKDRGDDDLVVYRWERTDQSGRASSEARKRRVQSQRQRRQRIVRG